MHESDHQRMPISNPETHRFVHIFFMDGVGVGHADPAINPFMSAQMPNLAALFGEGWFLQREERLFAERASFVPTDATLGVSGRPQSATGQSTILTGRNVPSLVGGHYGPKPDAAIAEVIRQGTLFHEVVAAGGSAALITPYPEQYFAAIRSGRRLLSAVPLAATSAGLTLMDAADLHAGRAVSPSFTGEAWREHLGYPTMPLLTLEEAGHRIAAIAKTHTFSFFEHWPSDRIGHRGSLEQAVQHLEILDCVLGALFAAWDERGLLIITSDHGNIEDKSRRHHTNNPVPTILMGQGHAEWARLIHDLTDIAKVVRRFLQLNT